MTQGLIGILGAGKSGIACAKLALKFGYNVLLSESSDKEINLINDEKLIIEIGGHSEKILQCDFIIISPGIPFDIQIVKEAIKKDIPVIGEIEFASWFTDVDILAITGSNGKSTTCMMLHHILLNAGFNSLLGGNIGVPFSENILIEHQKKCHVHVLELSSFQIESLKNFKSKISCVLNISEDHLDRYEDMNSYIDAKLKIINFSDMILYDSNDPILFDRVHKINKSQEVNSDYSRFKILNNYIYSNKNKENMFCLDDTNFIGDHNLLNALNACTVASFYGVPDERIIDAMKKIRPLRHRLELVADLDLIKFYNDSKSTNINSTIKALESFNENIVLILGGVSKGADFSELKSNLKAVKNIYCYGKSGQEIANSLKSDIHVKYLDDFSDCVKEAIGSAVQYDNVLLSPACASFDQFNNFEERGELFRKIVMERSNV